MLFSIVILALYNARWTTAVSKKELEFHKEFMNELPLLDKIKSKRVKHVMYVVDRKNYVSSNPYEEFPIPVGYGAHSSPQKVNALVLEALKNHLKEGSKVLDVGCGVGYLTACLALMVGKTGSVVGIDHIKELVEYAQKCVEMDKPALLKERRIMFVEGDGREGVPDKGPYDVINVGALTDEVPPALLQQLKIGGRMIIPMRKMQEGLYTNIVAAVDKLQNGSEVMVEVEKLFPDVYIDFLGHKEIQLGPTKGRLLQ